MIDGHLWYTIREQAELTTHSSLVTGGQTEMCVSQSSWSGKSSGLVMSSYYN